MSQTPDSVEDATESEGYLAAWKDITKMVHRGRSWSGHERNCVFLNMGGGQFADISHTSGFGYDDDARGVGIVDWDLDGDLDLWVTNRNSPQVRFLRNNHTDDQQFLAVRLIGRTVNRDAIGARIEAVIRVEGRGVKAEGRGEKGEFGEKTQLDDPASRISQPASRNSHPETRNRLVKTIRAGDGFLSQSSKWIHFGLGAARRIKKLVVQWPGGDREEFGSLDAGRRYILVQGKGVAEPWLPTGRAVHLDESTQPMPKPSSVVRHVLAARYPLANAVYEDLDGQDRSLRDFAGKPLLVNLWASWCRPCLVELKQFGQRAEELRALELQVVALSVDGLGDERSDLKDVANILRKVDFPFEVGMASRAIVDKIQSFKDDLLALQTPMPVPTSLLIGADGQVSVLYMGPVAFEQLLTDVELLSASGDDLFQAAIPFDGSWHAPPKRLRTDVYVNGGLELAGLGLNDDAAEYFRRAIQDDEDCAEAYYNLGMVLAGQRAYDEAVTNLTHAIRLNPQDAEAHFRLALVMDIQGNSDAARIHYQHTLRLRPDFSPARENLKQLEASQPQTGEEEKAPSELDIPNTQ